MSEYPINLDAIAVSLKLIVGTWYWKILTETMEVRDGCKGEG